MADSADPLPHVERAGGYSTRYPHRGHYFVNAAIGLLAFGTASLCLHRLLPFPEIPEVTAKLQYFAQHKDEFDTLFIGSSRIYHHVVPEVFDRAATEHGVTAHSFNLGVSGMHPPESFYVLDQVLRLKPAKLKWVFLEFEELYPNFSKEKLATRRFFYWHNWRLTRLALGKSLNPDGRQSWGKIVTRIVRSDTSRVQFQAFLKNISNVGAAKDVQDSLVTRDRRSSTTWRDLDRQHGYLPSFRLMTADEIAQYRAKVQNGVVEDDDYAPSGEPMSGDQLVQYRARLEKGMAEAHSHVVDPRTDEGFRDCAEKIRAAGAKLICVVSPNTNLKQLQFRNDAPAPVFAFNDPKLYSALYDPHVRVDPTHMTAEGAEQFTRLLAEQFAAEFAPPK